MRRMAIILTICALPVVAGCGKKSDQAAAGIQQERTAVETARAALGTVTVARSYTGTVDGIEHASLVAKLGETVERLNVRLGQRVSTGEVLLSLDAGGPSSQYHQAEALYQNKKKLFDKYQNLFQEGAVSEQELDFAKTDFKIAEANYLAAKELVNVPSPIDGEVTALNVNVGDQTYVGRPLATVSRTDSVRLVVGVDPADVEHIRVGDSASLAPEGTLGAVVSGRVDKVASSANPATRAFAVEIVASNREGKLKPGSFATATLKLYALENILVVPKDAILLQKGIPKLFTLRGDTARVREVSIGQSDGVMTEVKSGLEPGAEVVVLGQSFLSDGALVKVVSGKADPE